MQEFATILFLATGILYLFASVGFSFALGGLKVGITQQAGRIFGAAVACHAVHIIVASLARGICPVRGVHFVLSILAVVMGAAYSFLWRQSRLRVLGAFVAPLALTFFLASEFVASALTGATTTQRIQSAVVPIHVAANLVGEALFTLAFFCAALYLFQDSRLKQKRVEGAFKRLPPLDVLERTEHRFLVAGFPFLTVGILTGTLWSSQVEAGSVGAIWRAIFGYASWLIFASVLFLRSVAGWRGRRAAYGTIMGFGFALVILLLYVFRSQPKQAQQPAFRDALAMDAAGRRDPPC